MIHTVKILPEYFYPIRKGKKQFEIRNNDRNYKVGDIVVLKEWNSKIGYSGKEVRAEITFITDYEQKDGFVVFSFKVIDCKD